MNEQILLKKQMSILSDRLNILEALILSESPKTIGFDVSSVTIEQESDLIHNDVRLFEVDRIIDKPERVVSFWKQFYKDDGYSTKFVDRMPGLVVVNKNKEDVRLLVAEINQLKANVASTVRAESLVKGKLKHGRSTAEKHEFIHQLFPRIMTEHVYRNIHIIEHDVTNAWFNWVSRPVPKKLSVEAARDHLYNQMNRPNIGFVASEWNALIEASLVKLQTEQPKYVQVQKQFKVFPVMPFKFISAEGEIKRNTKNAITPFILLGQSNQQLPKYTNLSTYDSRQLPKRTPRLMTNKLMINDELGLIGVK